MTFYQSKALRWISLALRVILGAVFIYGGYVKLREPWALFAMGIDSYHLVPLRFVEPLARTLPWAEVALGVLLIVGVWLRVWAASVSLMLMGFFAAMLHAFITGKQIDCGCFGPGDPISKWTLLRDGSLLAGSLFLTWVAFRAPRRAA